MKVKDKDWRYASYSALVNGYDFSWYLLNMTPISQEEIKELLEEIYSVKCEPSETL